MICFVSANKGSIAQLLPLIDTIKSLTIVKSVLININSDPGDTILNYSPSSTSVLYGSSYIHENIAGINVKISLTSFTQSNPIQTKILYGTVHQLLQLNGTETLYDLYCGIGIIGLYLSPYVNKVVGIENNEDAINDARYNMVLNNIENINFICEKAEVFLPTLPIGENETIVINPPRKGCHTSLLHELIRRQVEKLVYISCNPITLARDLDILVSSGIYKIVTVQPIDMFPHTVHVETVVLLHINK
jgi:23S rRNA (uracil1939-C5)-methyltransferase